LFVNAFSVYNMDEVNAVRHAGVVRKSVPIFVGMKDLKDSKDEAYDTLDKNAPLYLPLGNSVNQPGGSEYTYNFWLYTDPSKTTSPWPTIAASRTRETNTDNGFEDDADGVPEINSALNNQIILFMRGSRVPYKYKGHCFDKNDPTTNYKTDIMIKSPLVKLERSLDVLTVEFNSMESPDAVLEQSPDTCNDVSTDWNAMHAYKVSVKNFSTKYPKQWNMVTIVLSDTYPSDPIPIRNKIRCSIYVNGVLELDKYIDSALGNPTSSGSTLKQNNGNFYINPHLTGGAGMTSTNLDDMTHGGVAPINNSSPIKDITTQPQGNKQVMMADLTYLNYVPTSDEIKSWFANGFTKKWAPSVSATQSSKLDDDLYTRATTVPDKAQLKLINRL